MDCTSAIHNPLAINLARQTRILLKEIGASSYGPAIQGCCSNVELLATLSKSLAKPSLTFIIAQLFRPILLDLCARWLEPADNREDELVALCSLVGIHEELFPILYRILKQPPFQAGLLQPLVTETSALSVSKDRLHSLLLAYYRILQINRELPEQLSWSLYPLACLVWTQSLDNGARMLAIQCYALQSGMGEAERISIETEAFGPPCEVDCWVEYGQEVDGTKITADGWVLPIIELKRIEQARNVIATDKQDFYSGSAGDSSQPILPSELSSYITDVHGVLLVRIPSDVHHQSKLVSTPTAIRALRSLALHLSLRVPMLITSPPSCGKSLLLSHLANILHPTEHNQIITIHFADTSLDPRSLLGTYVSSPTQPGVFEWKDGTLVRSMKQGKWVILEDIDRGSSEVLGVIKPLAESLRLGKWIGGCASIEVPGHGRVVAAHDFALFATRSIAPSKNGQFPRPTFFGAHKFHEIVVPSPSSEELELIIGTRFPRLTGSLAQATIRLWRAVVDFGSSGSTRDVGMRELEKFCQRVSDLLPSSFSSPQATDATISFEDMFPNSSMREEIFAEARDVFFGSGSITSAARAHLDLIANTIASHLGLDADRRQWVLSGATPHFDIEKDANGFVVAVRAGRTRLPACPSKPQVAPPSARPFALHKPAISLLSRIATAVSLAEPLLLTGETGTGKTSVVSYLASLLRRPLISLNLSHQTESADLLGGFKPVDARLPASSLHTRFLELFSATFSRKKNMKFEESVRKAVAEENWKRCVALWKEATRLAKDRITSKLQKDGAENSDAPRKRRKLTGDHLLASESHWTSFADDVAQFEVQYVTGQGRFAFGFVEGPLVKAIRNGDWVLLDEINLASSETLECISGLLHGPTSSITLTEQGALEPVPRHPDFRLFACMNPATDVGKKELPPNIRALFTEFDVPPPDADRETLLTIVNQYIGHCAVGDKAAIMNIAEFYAAVKQLAEAGRIADGSNHKPNFSMRTLARALTFAADITNVYGLRRAIWEGCLMAFTMILDAPSKQVVIGLAQKHLLAGVRNPRSMSSNEPSDTEYTRSNEYVKFGPFYLEKGPFPEDPIEEYIMTPSVEAKLIDLARIILTRRFPVLIEGPTSSGKTSSVEYLARRTGHRFVRINNHEHTDIQEYLGSYVSDPTTGKFVFKDGLLVQALRNGDWIVLDELNLAPTDVLEALNRLLDDNRELFIPETHEVVKPHPHFMLFAAQNPPGLYAGRKVLSRAFRSRFLEVHYEDVPQSELETILCQRCRIAPSYGKKIVNVFRELQKRRQSSRVFESKEGFATLRDLFRWAGRDAVGYQELAENGYMLLAERARRDDDKLVVKAVIESIMGVKLDEKSMYRLDRMDRDMAAYLGCPVPSSSEMIWTSAMQRLFILVARALQFNEPILLVGETGSGKTSVCQLYAETLSRQLHALNCHQNTETADLIGGLRPVRNRVSAESEVLREIATKLADINISVDVLSRDSLLATIDELLSSPSGFEPDKISMLEDARQGLHQLGQIFEWRDGPLIQAMQQGTVFLLDEISLADDSVLERLNSVLEPARTIVLAERGGDNSELPLIKAAEDFKLVATMNPGGDYGKKELSPALRNRFTEIWVPPVNNRSDLELIISNRWEFEALKPYTAKVLDFKEWLCHQVGDNSLTSLRDLLAWVAFSNAVYGKSCEAGMPPNEIFHHAAQMTFLDGLGSLPQLMSYPSEALDKLRREALLQLQELAPLDGPEQTLTYVPPHDPARFIQFGSFAISRGPNSPRSQLFNLQTPTTQINAMRVVRACQVSKPILLEGSPGVGKTTLITALANLAGHTLCRINLSDQTDLIDLFGSDLPVEGGKPGEFAWRDAEFLRALQDGHWVLLDEMNLAPQAVLEGLNAVLDHRGTVFIPELGRSFTRHPAFRIFAAQNPLSQGGGRKGLPKSFINRFTKVYIEEHTPEDLFMVCQPLFPSCETDMLRAMISYNTQLSLEVTSKRTFAREGAPWEFNLRDILRWCSLIASTDRPQKPIQYLRTIYLHRFRTKSDRDRAEDIFEQIFHISPSKVEYIPHPSITPSFFQVGRFHHSRGNFHATSRPGRLLQAQLPILESLGHCIKQNWLTILTGPQESGKSEVVKLLANITGNILHELAFNSATDTMDILGSFEQLDSRSHAVNLLDEALETLRVQIRSKVGTVPQYVLCYQRLRDVVNSGSPIDIVAVLRHALTILDDLPSDDRIKRHQDTIHGYLERQENTKSSAGQFVWVDGPLVRAAKQGHWLLINGANLCSPSILDRLNSLCEPNGELILSERGFVNGVVQVIKPHPNFRLFMSVDPQYGELSRAMRNRGVEVSISTHIAEEDIGTMQDFLRLPKFDGTTGLLQQQGILFDIMRRGILSSRLRVMSSTTSSGWPLENHSSFVALMDPLVIESNTCDLGCVTDDLLHFHARAHSLLHIPYLMRTLDALAKWYPLSQLKSLSSCLAWPRLIAYARDMQHLYSDAWDVPLELAKFQSIIILLTIPVSGRHQRIGPIQRLLFTALDICVSLFQHQEINTSAQPLVASNKNDPIRGEVERAISHILKSSRSFMDSSDESFDIAHITPDDLDVVRKLLGHAMQLRRITDNPFFNYSAAQTIVNWMTEILQSCSPRFQSWFEAIRGLKRALSPTTGLGLMDIWSALFLCLPKKPLAIAKNLDVLAARLGSEYRDLRRDAFDVMALHTVCTNAEDGHLNVLITKLKTHLCDQTDIEETAQDTQVDISTLITELRVHSIWPRNESNVMHTIKQLIELNCIRGGQSLYRYIFYQHLLWSMQTDTPALPLIASLHVDWHQALWDHKPLHNVPSGPATLLVPALLVSSFASCRWDTIYLGAFEDHRSKLHVESKLLLMHLDNHPSRVQQISRALWVALLLICSCFASSYGKSTLEELQRLMTFETQIDIQNCLGLLGQTTNEVLKMALKQFIDPLFHQLGQLETQGQHNMIPIMGSCWIAVGRMMLHLFVPDAPIDPAAIHAFEMQSWHEELKRISGQISLHAALESVTTGNPSNVSIDLLNERQTEISNCISTTGDYPIRSDVSQTAIMWSEVSQFQGQVVSPTKLGSLVDSMMFRTPSALEAEHVVQQSIAGFCQRLDSVYSDYADINTTLKLASAEIRLGLRLISHSCQHNSSDSSNRVATLASALVAFPFVKSSSLLLASVSMTGAAGLSGFQHILLNLSAIALERHLGVSLESFMDILQSTSSQALHMWLIDRARENELERTSQSLYHSRLHVHEATTEVEAEEEEFLALFPSFEDAFNHKSRTSDGRPDFINSDDIHEFVSVHRSIMISQSTSTTALTQFDATRKSALDVLLRSQVSSLPEILDHDSPILRLRLLRDRVSGLSPTSSYNFYTDANISETSKGAAVIQSLIRRVDSLLHDWPDQVILQDLKRRCELFLEFDVQSPVAKILSALEQLLIQSEDWEAYANRDTSLKTDQQAITSLIVEWRRLELSSWQALLETESTLSAHSSSVWWFRLYNALIHGTLEAIDKRDPLEDQSLSNYLRDLVPLLDDFIRSSPLGQFQARMQLLRDFTSYSLRLISSSEGVHQTVLERVHRILYHIGNSFGLYTEQLTVTLSTQRASLEKEIKDLIKLASWKDVNVHALKQSARRSHYQLFKIIRKYRDLLRQPIGDKLVAQMANAANIDTTAVMTTTHPILTPPSFPPLELATAPHLTNLDRTYAKFQTLLHSRILVWITNHPADPVDDFAKEIIASARHLASIQIPKSDKAEVRLKSQKALLVRKRKAWNDLLKELKLAGFSSAVKTEVLRNQADVLWMRDQPILPLTALPTTSDCEKYFWRLCTCLPEVRKSLANHHPDLNTRELQRGLMFLESGFSLALDMRKRLAAICNSHTLLNRIIRRLKTISSCPSIVNYGTSMVSTLVHLQNLLSRMHGALTEMTDALKIVQEMGAYSEHTLTIIEHSNQLSFSTKNICQRLASIIEAVNWTPFPLLLGDESDFLSVVYSHLDTVSVTLSQWSKEHPHLFRIFHSVQAWLESQTVPQLPSKPIVDRVDASAETVIDSFLIVVQDILAKFSLTTDHTEQDREAYIRDDVHAMQNLSNLLDLTGTASRLNNTLAYLTSRDRDGIVHDLRRLLPFVDLYANIAETQLNAHAGWLRSLLKLNYVVCSVIHTLATQGFCKPPDTEEAGEGGDSTQVDGGVGLGEGTGSENVSKEIEEEHQVEGLQGDDSNDADENDVSDDPNAIEMSEDIGGEMGDVAETGSQEGEESDDDTKDEPDEQLGKLDRSDPAAVDEKLWGDEQGPTPDQEDDKINQDRSQDASADSEVVAKEGSQSKRDPQGEKEQEKLKETSDDGDGKEEDNTEERDVNDDQSQGEPPGADGAPMDEFVQDANTLDLPDDLNLGPEEADGGEMDVDSDSDMPEPMDDDVATGEDDHMAENFQDNTLDTGMEEAIGEDEDAPHAEPDDNDTPPGEDQSADQAIAPADISSGDGYANEEQSQAVNRGNASVTTQTAMGQGGAGSSSAAQEDQTNHQDSIEKNPMDHNISQAETEAAGDSSSGSQQGPTSTQERQDGGHEIPNPLRSLSDALQEIRRRLGPILEANEPDVPLDKSDNSAPAKQVEYVQPGDEDHEMDALGPAGEEQAAQLNKLKLIDEEELDEEHAMDMDMDPGPAQVTQESAEQSQAFEGEQTSTGLGMDVEPAIVSTLPKGSSNGGPSKSSNDISDVKAENESERKDSLDVETRLCEWQSMGQPEYGAEHIWRLYESLTSDLSHALCEQLRLILEPTLATRLKGDYRTGKRLNMKKVIAYIASDYTKDKIWLRRTRPSQREYQILIALDDSRSMAESHSVHLAFQTLALVSKALTRLEVGDIGIAKFGETVDLLHGFDEGPFNDLTGTRIISAFKFDQKATNVLSLVQKSLQILEHARERRPTGSSTAADLWQLQIIVSDGICQDHEQLRTILRKAAEQRIMIVFIIIDSLHPPRGSNDKGSSGMDTNSILSMEKAAFKTVDGRMELQLERYMDSFPFEYYVVLRSVEALPDVLASTLKQFFERISGQ